MGRSFSASRAKAEEHGFHAKFTTFIILNAHGKFHAPLQGFLSALAYLQFQFGLALCCVELVSVK
jgi:hypothetical protein